MWTKPTSVRLLAVLFFSVLLFSNVQKIENVQCNSVFNPMQNYLPLGANLTLFSHLIQKMDLSSVITEQVDI